MTEQTEWDVAEQADLVRLSIVADDTGWDLDELFGDTYNPKVNSDIDPERLARERREEVERVNSEGVWGIVGQYRCPCCKTWINADSIWGFVGEDWKDSVYDTDIQDTTLKARADVLSDLGALVKHN